MTNYDDFMKLLEDDLGNTPHKDVPKPTFAIEYKDATFFNSDHYREILGHLMINSLEPGIYYVYLCMFWDDRSPILLWTFQRNDDHSYVFEVV